MKTRIGVLFVLAAIIVPIIVAKALTQSGGDPSVSITDVSQSGPGQPVAVSGTFSAPSGYSVVSITVDIQPTGGVGGEGGEGLGFALDSNFSAQVNVPAGTFDVQAYIAVMDSSGNTLYYFSDAVIGFTVN